MATRGQALHSAAGKTVNFGIIAAFAAFAAFPFLWMLITTFKQTTDLLDPTHNPFVYHLPPTMQNVNVLLQDTLFVRWVGNTLFVGVVVVFITLLLAVPAGYALARLTGTIGEQLGVGIFLTYLVPPTILFIPLSRVVASLGLQDSLWALVLVYPSFTVPFCTWLMMGFFKVIPKDIEEAAMMDGLSRFGAFVRVILPMSVAGLLTVVIFAFTLVLQEFVYGLTFITSARNFTISVGVPTFLVRGDVYFWGSLMAACFIASVPIAFLYNLFVDRFISGFTVGAVKG
jgi:multiple sugar transport system permease protein